MSTADAYWAQFPDLVSVDAAATILKLRAQSVRAALKADRLAGYNVERQWLIAKQDLMGYIATDPRQAKNDVRLAIDAEPVLTEEVAAFLRTYPAAIKSSTVAKLLGLSPSALAKVHLLDRSPAFTTDVTKLIDRAELVEFLRSSMNLGPRYE